MKRTITFISLLALLMLPTLGALASRLVLLTPSHRAMVSIQGDQFYTNNGRLTVDFLRPGNHHIAIREMTPNRGYRDYRYGRRYQEFNHPHHRQQFVGRIHIAPHSTVYARLTPRGHLVVDRVVRNQHGPKHHHPRNHPHSDDRRYDNRRYDDRRYDRDDWDRDDRDRRDDRDYRERRDYPRHREFGSSFSQALNSVNDASFESQRLSLAKGYVQNNTITSNEVLRMIKAFDFESSRLAFAKAAYRNTIDKENYYIVNRGFDFSSSVTALNRYIR